MRTVSDPADVEAESRELCEALIAAEGQIQPSDRTRASQDQCTNEAGIANREIRIFASLRNKTLGGKRDVSRRYAAQTAAGRPMTVDRLSLPSTAPTRPGGTCACAVVRVRRVVEASPT